MARPWKERYITITPLQRVFQPVEDGEIHERVFLTADELEALRLADLLGYEHSESAVAMNISRQTFGRILERAHAKVADALVNAKLLEIGGGPVVRTQRRRIRCQRCKREWPVPHKEVDAFQCPRCQK